MKAEITVNFNDAISEIISGAVNRGLWYACAKIQEIAKRNAPGKGTLKNCIEMEVDEGTHTGYVFIASNSPAGKYADLIELFGRKPGYIYPKDFQSSKYRKIKHALWWKGAPHPMWRVYHPGFEARPFLRPAMYDNTDKIIQIGAVELQKVLK